MTAMSAAAANSAASPLGDAVRDFERGRVALLAALTALALALLAAGGALAA